MATIEILRRDGKYVFEPPVIEIERNDFIIWVNMDPGAAHQPTLFNPTWLNPQQSPPSNLVGVTLSGTVERANYWMKNPLPAFVEGQDAASSPAISFAPESSTIYVDGLDLYARFDGPWGLIIMKK